MPGRYDVAVIGLGAAGSSALLSLARRGLRVVGLDRFSPPHNLGSSHGRSRIIRQAYYESPAYVPLVQLAWERWLGLERDSGRALLTPTGGLMLGAPDGELVQGAAASAAQHGLPHEHLDRRALAARFPDFAAPEGTAGLLEPMAGILDPEACITAALDLAARAGAEIRVRAPVREVQGEGDHVRVMPAAGPPLEAGKVVLAAGTGMPGFLAEVVPLEVERQTMFWFRPRSGGWRAEERPVFIWEWEPGRIFYGLPDQGHGVKVARHHEGEPGSPAEAVQTATPAEEALVSLLVRRYLPTLEDRAMASAVCHYTNSPDRHFVIGPHPANERIILCSACSGHGFKFASALGEVLADLAGEGRSGFGLEPFRPGRFQG